MLLQRLFPYFEPHDFFITMKQPNCKAKAYSLFFELTLLSKLCFGEVIRGTWQTLVIGGTKILQYTCDVFIFAKVKMDYLRILKVIVFC